MCVGCKIAVAGMQRNTNTLIFGGHATINGMHKMPNKSQQLLATVNTAIGYYRYILLFCVYITNDFTGRTEQKEGPHGR